MGGGEHAALRGAHDPASAAPTIQDAEEILFWTLMRRFELQAVERYRAYLPALATADKEDFVKRLSTLTEGDELPPGSELAERIEKLFACAQSANETSTLIVQGLVLEHLGQAIYRIAEKTDRASTEARSLAREGLAASEGVTNLASKRITERVGTHETLYAVFAEVSHDVLGALDAVGEPVDRVFGARFGLHFADVMGEFTADLIGACTELGMQRRKVVAHLAGACMGL